MTTELRYVLLGLLEAGAIKFGNFRLKLHETRPDAPLSPIYVDLRVVRSFPWLLRTLAGFLGRKAAALSPDFVADVPTAATPLVSIIAASFNIPMVTPRPEVKTHGVAARVEGVSLAGSKGVLIDDLITTAESKIAALEILRDAGLVVDNAVVFLDREQGGKEQLARAGCRLHVILRMSEMLDLFVTEHKLESGQRAAIDDYFSQMPTYRSAV